MLAPYVIKCIKWHKRRAHRCSSASEVMVWHDFFSEHDYAEISIEDADRSRVSFTEIQRRARWEFDEKPHLAGLLQRH